MPQAKAMLPIPSTSSRTSKGFLQRAHEYRAVFTAILAAVAVVLSLIGWVLALDFKGPREFVSLIALVAGSFVPSASLATETHANMFIATGRFFGMAASIFGVILISIATMGQTLASFWTRHYRRGHAIVVGETALAQRIVRILRNRGMYTVQVVPQERSPALPADASKITGLGLADLVRDAGLSRANTVIVDAGSDAATLSAGHTIWTWLSENGHGLERLALRVTDPLLADATAAAMLPKSPKDPPRPLLFDENQIMAQAQLRTMPLFRVAHAMQQRRVHALILGFGDLGEKLLDQVMLTSIAGRCDTPMVTVVDRDATRAEVRFRARRPHVLHSLNVKFLGLDVGVDPLEDGTSPEGLAQLLKRCRSSPLTSIFVSLTEDSETLQAANLLRRLRQSHRALAVPLVYARRSADAWPMGADARWSESALADGMFAMTLSDHDLAECLLAPASRMALARKLHETYRTSPETSGAAAVPWDALPETYRRATLRAADHLPAKLWTLGLSPAIDPHRGLTLSAADSEKLDAILANDKSPQLADLARIEHERWCVERKLDGWRYAAKRDNTLLLHHLLVPWKQLRKKPAEVKKDADQVLAALRQIATRRV